MNQTDWRKDPRLTKMDQNKLDFIQTFAEKIKSSPKNQILPLFLSLQAESSNANIRFTDQETDLIVSILTDGMSPAEKSRLETLKLLAKKMAARSS